jgi:hypothetical protein
MEKSLDEVFGELYRALRLLKFVVAGLIVLSVSMLLTTCAHAGEAPWLDRALQDIGRNPTGWSHQWCARWLDMVTPGSGGNLAIGYRRYGRPSPARPGAIAVMSHHVGIVKEVRGNSVVLVSGNHSGRSGRRVVGIGTYPMSRIVAFRWPG